MEPAFIRQEEAIEVRKRKADNLITQQLVDMATVQALLFTPKETHAWPVADFDMNYFVEVMLNLFKVENHKTLKAILDGEDLRWWNDEDFNAPG